MVAAAILSTLLILSCQPSALLDFALPKWKADPNVRIEDAYKWLYQATRGGEHAAPYRESAKQWLETEWQSLDKPGSSELAWEPLCSDGSIGRLNLRVYKAKGGKMEDVLDAFLASAREFKAEQSAFTDAWAELGQRLKKKRIGELDHNAWEKLDTEMQEQNYPAIHHSEQYNKTRRPAYRILTLIEARRLIPT